MNRIIINCIAGICAVILLASCGGPSFTTANNMQNMYGTVYMVDGRELQGQISVSLEGSFNRRDYIRFTPRNGREKQKIYIDELAGFSLNNDYYAPKKVDMGFLSGDRMLFLKQLTRSNSRIHLYELMRRRENRNNNQGGVYYTVEYNYFITLPQHDRFTAWSLDGRNLVPNFEDKMSEYVKDCPALAEKIKRKDRGYFYAQVSLSDRKRTGTILNIIDDYNACR